MAHVKLMNYHDLPLENVASPGQTAEIPREYVDTFSVHSVLVCWEDWQDRTVKLVIHGFILENSPSQGKNDEVLGLAN